MSISRPIERLLSIRSIVTTTFAFVLIFAVANRAVRYVDNHLVDIDRPPFWPIGVFEPRWPTKQGILLAVLCAIAFLLLLIMLRKTNYSNLHVIIAGLILVAGTNSLHGIDAGWAQPISGGHGASAIQYYHDSLKIKGTRELMLDYTANQTALLAHARTHPPGAVGFIHVLRLMLERPAYISAAIALISITLLALFAYGLLREFGSDPPTAGYAVLLLLLVPAVQIYSLASIDAVIAALFLGCIYFVRQRDPVFGLGAALCLFFASFMTFAAIFLVVPMFAVEWGTRRRFTRSLSAITLVVAGYLALRAESGFNYLLSFGLAAGMENPQGLRLIAEPASYFFTRVECVCEILLFLGPFLTLMGIRGVPSLAGSPKALFWSSTLTLLAMFAFGTYHTAETARACLFIYPFLLLPVVTYLKQAENTEFIRHRLAFVLFGQTLTMQLLGDYFW